ncbi:restriction endonuclease subunit S [Xenorhabdus littoralis]|uniref:restriction endonuclease subunit S n=1 Tax=Xenorhabdus littoralis TaxID=2582835 RepID=UPI0029E7FE66|nr:restriction endonuclease subunit S [Xenorhabdus sp. psl]MDX7990639.1 restriction endonuclease subunit S [Xenorhabdus sp. psl]
MSKYQAYSEYKYSGVEWLGKIPKHWNVCRLKHLVTIRNGQDYKMVQSDAGYPVIGSGGQFAFSTQYMYDKPSVLLGRKGTIDKPLYVNEPFWTVDTMYYTEMRDDVDAGYLYYLALTIQFDRYSTSTALPSMTQENLGNYFFAVSNEITERLLISTFLDHETAKIDILIEKQQQLITLLKEKRQAVISHAVTKGLNPDSPMKDSGVEWLGNVPTHWNITRIGFHTLKIGSGKTPKGGAEIYQEDGVLFLRSQNIYDDGLRIGKSESVFISENIHEEMKGTKVYGGDILLNITGGSIGRSCLVPKNFIETNVNQHVCIIRMPKSLSEYVSLVMKSVSIKEQIVSIQTGGNREGLNFEQISKFVFCLPSEKERISLIKYIHSVLKKFDSLESKANEVIRLMQERRTALISAAITGKIDVRHWQAPVTHQASNHSAYQSHLCRHDLSKVS